MNRKIKIEFQSPIDCLFNQQATPKRRKPVSNFQLFVFSLLTLMVSAPALASYKDGFFALVIIFFSLPVIVIGITIMIFMVSTEKFKQIKTYRAYRNTWITILTVSGIGLSIMALDGDPTSSVAIAICWVIYGLILILPATIQSKRKRDSRADSHPREEI